jgi:hypothetical protein
LIAEILFTLEREKFKYIGLFGGETADFGKLKLSIP